MSDIQRPKVGISHIKGIIKQTRASGYNIFSCLKDLIDNVVCKCKNIHIDLITDGNQKLKTILIHDDYVNGFENVDSNGSDNPFNLAHMRIGHDDDGETSEFGTGMKRAAISCGDIFEVFTRANKNYWHIKMDFDRMSQIDKPEESYEPTIYFTVDEGYYKQTHMNSDFGSTIIISNLTTLAGVKLDDKIDYNGVGEANNYYDTIKYQLGIAYSDLLMKDKIKIFIKKNAEDYNEIKYCNDFKIFENKVALRRMIKHTIYCKIIDNEINAMCIKRDKPGDGKRDVSYYIYSNNFKYDKHSIKEQEFNEFINKPNIYELEILSTSIGNKHNTSDSDKKELDKLLVNGEKYDITNGYNKIFISRNDRCYDIVSYITSKDGYQNHIYNKLVYKSKKINKFLGITFNKNINVNYDSPLIELIKYIQRQNRNSPNLGKYNKEKKEATDVDSETYDSTIHENINIVKQTEPIIQPRKEPKVAPKVEPKVEPKVAPKVEPKVELKVEPKVAPKVEPKVEPNLVHHKEPKIAEIKTLLSGVNLYNILKNKIDEFKNDNVYDKDDALSIITNIINDIYS